MQEEDQAGDAGVEGEELDVETDQRVLVDPEAALHSTQRVQADEGEAAVAEIAQVLTLIKEQGQAEQAHREQQNGGEKEADVAAEELSFQSQARADSLLSEQADVGCSE